MSFDAWVVGYGISTLLQQLHLVETEAAFWRSPLGRRRASDSSLLDDA